MPRQSPFRIVLTPDEARTLAERARKYTLPYFQVVRAKMVLLAAQGLANDEIAAALSTCPSPKPGPADQRLIFQL